MGSLTVPSSGVVYLDANCIIYRIERISPYCSQLDPVFSAAFDDRISMVTSELSLVECLVAPIRKNEPMAETAYRSVLEGSRELSLISISRQILDRAARIRARHGLRTPDAIHAATCMEIGCSAFYTNDVGMTKCPELPVQLLDR